jgi:hypothetical protein
MIFIEDYDGCYGDALERYYNFNKYASQEDRKVFFHGMGCIEKTTHKEAYSSYDKKIFWNLEQPCAWQGDTRTHNISSNADGYFDKIFTICPYSAEWLNSEQNTNVFAKSFIPFSEDMIVEQKDEKTFDAIYWGGIHGEENFNIVNTIKDFKYNFMSLGSNYWSPPYRNSIAKKYITSQNIPRKIMWALLRKTKVCPMSNLLFLQDQQVANIKSMKNWQNCEAFSHLDNFIMPQNKTRMIECAVNRALILVKRNPWDLDSMWFEPDKEFLYFDDYQELPKMIKDISENWHNYEHIVENAFSKAKEKYTVKQFINMVERETN